MTTSPHSKNDEDSHHTQKQLSPDLVDSALRDHSWSDPKFTDDGCLFSSLPRRSVLQVLDREVHGDRRLLLDRL